MCLSFTSDNGQFVCTPGLVDVGAVVSIGSNELNYDVPAYAGFMGFSFGGPVWDSMLRC